MVYSVSELSWMIFAAAKDPEPAALPNWIGVPISLALIAGIAFAYKGHGFMGISLLVGYLSSITCTTLSMKYIMAEYPYPLFMTTLHFICSLATVFAIFPFSGEEYPKHLSRSDFPQWLLRAIVPPAVCVYLSIVMNNTSLMYIGAGLSCMIALATPVTTAIVSAMFGLKIALMAWVGILVAISGDAFLTVAGFQVQTDVPSDLYMLGIMLSVASLFARGAKTALQDKLMNNYGTATEDQMKLSPLGLWCFQGPLLILIGLPCALFFEGLAPITNISVILANPFLLLGNICGAIGVNILGMCVCKMLGAPAAQICGKFNVFITAALS